MRLRYRYLTGALCLAFILLTPLLLPAQNYNPFNERDDTYRLLGLKRAKQLYETAREDFDRQQSLYEKNMITKLELEQARDRFTDAEVNYQQSLLAVLFEKQFITVMEAVKYQARDGSKHVRLKLANTSGGSAEFQKLVKVDDALFRSLQPDIINNIYVSILNDDNAIISQPYEAKIDELHFGEPAELDFALLQDLDAVTIQLIYGNGTTRAMKIFLQKDESVNRVIVQSEQFSQEVELGTSASFDLTLELFSGTNKTFSLEVVNLPRQIARHFKDPAGSVRLSQVKFTESSRTKRAALEISLPDRPDDGVVMDIPIPFYVLVLPREKISDLPNLRTHEWTEDEIEALDVGYVRLELVPRGKGDLLVKLPQLYHSLDSDETASVRMDVLNEGSHRVDNIEIRADLPLNWTKVIDPEQIASLEIGQGSPVTMAFTPPEDVAPGKYEIRVQTSGLSNGQPVTAEDKTITIEIRSGSNVFGTIILVVLLVGLVGGIVVYGTRLSRR